MSDGVCISCRITDAVLCRTCASRYAEVAELRANLEKMRLRAEHYQREYRECAEQRLAAQAEVERWRSDHSEKSRMYARMEEERDQARRELDAVRARVRALRSEVVSQYDWMLIERALGGDS